MLFQKRFNCQEHKYKFHLDTVALKHTKNYTYLDININTRGNFHNTVNDLRDKVRSAFYAIKKNITFDIPTRIWLKIPLPFMVVRTGVRSPTKNSQHHIETSHAEFCKNILCGQRKTPNNAYRA